MKHIPPMQVKLLARSPYRDFGWGRLPVSPLTGVRVGCPPHRHIVPLCRNCGHVGEMQHWCKDCRRVLNSTRGAPNVDCRHTRTTTRCPECELATTYAAACTDCRKIVN